MKIAKNIYKWPLKWIESVYSRNCIICADSGVKKNPVCNECKQFLPYCQTSCLKCGAFLEIQGDSQTICGKCQKQAPLFDELNAMFWYERPIDKLIVDFKYNNQWQNIQSLFELSCDSFAAYCQDTLVVPVPSHPARIRSRGFNAVYELLKLMSTYTRFDYNDKLIIRTLNTPAQAGQSKNARRRNLDKAFKVCRKLPSQKILIIDDVVTTGSTVNEMSRCLKKAGAKKIGVWAVARAK